MLAPTQSWSLAITCRWSSKPLTNDKSRKRSLVFIIVIEFLCRCVVGTAVVVWQTPAPWTLSWATNGCRGVSGELGEGASFSGLQSLVDGRYFAEWAPGRPWDKEEVLLLARWSVLGGRDAPGRWVETLEDDWRRHFVGNLPLPHLSTPKGTVSVWLLL